MQAELRAVGQGPGPGLGLVWAWAVALACTGLCVDAGLLLAADANPRAAWRLAVCGAALAGAVGVLVFVIATLRHQRLALANARLAALQRRRSLQDLLDLWATPVALGSAHDACAMLNPAMAHLLQSERGEAANVAFNWQQAVQAEDWPAWVAATALALRDGHSQWLRCTLRLGEKSSAVLAQIAPLAGEDGIELAVSLTLPQGVAGLAQETILQLTDLLDLAEAEKWHFGQAVHDELGQRLSGMAYFAKALQRELQQAQRVEADKAAWLTDLANESMAAARDLARGLVPVGADDPDALATALAELCARVGKTFQIDCTLQADPEFDPGEAASANHLYRAIQELITNGIKHGQARRVHVALQVQPDGQRVTVHNDGSGLDEPPQRFGMGLNGVRSRAAYLGAHFSLANASPHGVLAVIDLPGSRRLPDRPATRHDQATTDPGAAI